MGHATARTWLYQYVPDNVVQLGAAAFVRRIVYGNKWQRIRMGFLAAISPASPHVNLNSVKCYFGLSSSLGLGPDAPNTGNFVGYSLTGGLAGGNFTSTAAYPNSYWALSSSQVFGKAGAYTNTTTSADANQINWSPARLGNSRRFPYILDIMRSAGGGGTYTFYLYALSTAAHSAVDHRPDHLMACLDSTGTPISNGQTLSVISGGKTINWSEATGPLDSIYLYWNKTNWPLEVSAIGAVLHDNVNYPDCCGGFLETWTAGSYVSDVYSYGTVLSGTMVPYYASAPITSSGSADNLAIYDTVSGTSTGPADDFESYSVGTVNSGTTLTGGLGFDGPGYVYQW